MTTEATLVLNHRQINQKIIRIAHELVEHLIDDDEIILVGIEPRGNILADRLQAELEKIDLLKSSVERIKMDKNAPLSSPMMCTLNKEDAEGKTIIVVDDVLNSGKALIYASKFLLDFGPKSMHTVTLIDRRHREFPIRADFVGMTLATTIRDHISVQFGSEDKAVLI